MKKKVLLVNLPFGKLYEGTKLARMTHSMPPLSLAVLGGALRSDGHDVRAIDFNLPENNLERFVAVVRSYEPDFVGITYVTPLFSEMQRLAAAVKEIDRRIVLIGGGPHCSTYPEQSLEESDLDVVVTGEGDSAIRDVVNYHGNGKEKRVVSADPIEELDSLAYPAYDLYENAKYRIPRSIARKSPAAWMETSRGCLYRCVYCNKNIFRSRFRTKSVERVVEEMERLKRSGFRETHFTDDAFTTDLERAKNICDLLMKREVNLGFALINGIRVNQLDYELLSMLKRAGCYKVFFGIESGNQQILNNIRKGATVEQVVQAVHWATKAGLEVWGSFMIGLPGETEETMKDTLRFAKQLPLDLAKMSIHIPLPGTPIFEEWAEKGYIKTKNWDKFSFHTPPVEVYDHPTLSWDQIREYHDRFYRDFYFRPGFVAKRIIYGFRNRTFLEDLRVFIGTRWRSSAGSDGGDAAGGRSGK